MNRKITGGRTEFVNTTLDPELKRWLREEAARRQTTLSSMVYELILAERKRVGHAQ